MVAKGTATLANIAFNNPDNVGFEMEENVPYTLKVAMRTHPNSVMVQDSCVTCISNLVNDRDPVREYVCATCSDEILLMLNTHVGEAPLFRKALLALGNMSMVDGNIISLVKKGAVRYVVAGMKRHVANVDFVRTALDVLSNFGAIDDDDLDAEATECIINDGGLEQLVACLKFHHTNSSVLISGMEALYNIGNDDNAADLLVNLNVLEMTLLIMQTYDYEKSLVRHCMRFLSVLTYAEVSLARFNSLTGVAIMIQVMRGRGDQEDLLLDALAVLTNVFILEENRRAFLEAGGLTVLFQFVELFTGHSEITKAILNCLCRSAQDDILSTRIAEDGMHLFMTMVAMHLDDTAILSQVFELLGHLAFVKSNLKIIVQVCMIICTLYVCT